MVFKKKYLIFLALLILMFSISSAYANDLDDVNIIGNSVDESLDAYSQDNIVTEQSNEITVANWDDLQYYCSLKDKNYVLKLKEDTNYYPTNPEDNSYQIQVNNNVTILGSSGAYIGDASPNARAINYLAINVPENSGLGLTLKGITFKWISTEYQPNAVFLQMAGNANNVIEDCQFTNCTLDGGHSSLVYLLRGYALIVNSTFTNIISDFGCVSIYDPTDDIYSGSKGACMDIDDCYFEGNYAKTEPGCINNCGQLVVTNSTFYKNTAVQWAGAIHTHCGANTTIYDSNFTDNLAGWNGGALYTYSYLQVYNTIFIGNNCTTNNGGGAIGAYSYLTDPHAYIKDCLFMDNENLCWSLSELSTDGVGRGGAISVLGKGSISVLNNTFIKNSAAIGTAVCVVTQGQLYPTDTTITGNRFINHTRAGDVLVINLNSNSLREIHDNYYLNNSIEFSKLKLTADDKIGDEVTLHIDAVLTNEKYYDSDILNKSGYDVYMDGRYYTTVNGTDFTLNLKNIENSQVYVIPCISNSKSNEVSVGIPKEYIYVSQISGNDDNNGSTRQSAVATFTKACELAKSSGNIIIMDGTFSDSNIMIDYDLKITGEDDVKFSGTSSDSIFTITNNSDFTISNVIFENLIFTTKNTGIIRQTAGFTVIDNCEFNDNYVTGLSGAVLIEARNIEIYNSRFADNSKNNLILIKSNEFLIDNCTFLNNSASDSTYYSLISTAGEKTGVKGTVSNSIFKSNRVKYGCIYFDANGRPLSVTDTGFIANRVSSANDHASCIKIANSPEVKIDSCTFADNVDLGTRSAVIYVEGGTALVYVSNSAILNNSYENTNNLVFSASKSENLGVYKNLNGNWWGNTLQNFTVAPAVYASACDNWLFLNVSANETSICKNQKVLITYDLNNQATRSGDVSYYDAGKFDYVSFDIKTSGGKADDSEISLVNGAAQTVYTLTSYYGEITAHYSGIALTLNFTQSRSKPDMNVKANDSYVGQPVIVEIEFLEDAEGNLTVFNQTVPVTGSKTIFTVNDLPAGEHVIEVSYSGDDNWLPASENVTVTVNKNNSTTKITAADIVIGNDVVLTIDVTETATGNITLIVNNKNETLTITNSKANYTIKSISRGNYNITAIYNGDSKYLTSSDNLKFGVGRIKPEYSVTVLEITYGHDATFNVVLNNNATGEVFVNVDDKNKTSELENGQATIFISDLSAGTKTAHIYYDGDDYYDSFNDSCTFNVLKANTTLTISAENIMIGADVNIEVIVPAGVTGNVTINCGENTTTKPLNVLGKVLWTLPGLAVGPYTVSAELISDNYNTVENKITFTVSDYSAPQWPNQGYDVGNDGKSPYDTNSNGAVIWSYKIDGKVTGNLIVDSEGNICIVTSSGVYSVDDTGKQRWNYSYMNENISGIAVSRDVVIIPIAGNTLYLLNQTTGQRYGHSNIYQASSLFVPVVDSDSNIYVSSEYQHAAGDYKLVVVPYSLWEYGGNPILVSLGSSQPTSAPVIVGDKYAVIACTDGIKIIDLDKKEISSTISGDTHAIRPAVSSESIVYAVLNDNIQAMTPQGNVIWKTPLSCLGGQLALDEENGLYLINSQGNLYKYDLVDGSEELISDLNFTSGMLIGNDGNIYVAVNEMLYAFDNGGNVLWKSDMGGEIVGTPVMDENGVIYLATSNALNAIGKSDLADANIKANISDIKFGENASVVITIQDDLTGTVNVEIDSESYEGIISANNLVITVPNLSAGHKTANIVYSGDGRFKSKEMSCEFTVLADKLPSEINLTVGDIKIGADTPISIEIQGATGDVHVYIDDKESVKLLINGKTSFNVSSLAVGNHIINVTYYGDENHDFASVRQFIPASAVSSRFTDLTVDGKGIISAVLVDGLGNSIPDAKISYNVGESNYTSSTNENGEFTIKVNANGIVKIDYDGSDLILPTDISITLNLASNRLSTSVVGDNYTQPAIEYYGGERGGNFTVQLVDQNGKPLANKVVYIGYNGKCLLRTTDDKGFASVQINLVAENRLTFAVAFLGDEDYSASMSVYLITITKKAVTISAPAKTFKASAKTKSYTVTLKTDKNKFDGKTYFGAGKKVTLTVNGVSYTAKTNDKGQATFKLSLTKKGTYSATVSYAGDNTYKSAKATAKIKIS